jgi:hypothetical protein
MLSSTSHSTSSTHDSSQMTSTVSSPSSVGIISKPPPMDRSMPQSSPKTAPKKQSDRGVYSPFQHSQSQQHQFYTSNNNSSCQGNKTTTPASNINNNNNTGAILSKTPPDEKTSLTFNPQSNSPNESSVTSQGQHKRPASLHHSISQQRHIQMEHPINVNANPNSKDTHV